MKDLILKIDNSSEENLYLQIYNAIRMDIINGTIPTGTKIPSLRKLAKDNAVSVTTVETAYNQLLVEGYIESRPKSGYYVCGDIAEAASGVHAGEEYTGLEELLAGSKSNARRAAGDRMVYDDESFEFSKWKTCMNRVFNEYSSLLQTEGDIQGEPALRYEIAKYLFSSRGVRCTPEQIVIGAGSQQLAGHLVRILREMGVDNAATEMPGYTPIRNILREGGISVQGVGSDSDGIEIGKLPVNVRSIVYVDPSHLFPSGEPMPIKRRYELIKWAKENDSYILEDDYDAELRYSGKPIPAMQGLDTNGRVIYMGSFSSTLFGSIKISYMVLPDELMSIFDGIKMKYSQTCSKAEQICLALYMEAGYYHRHIKKLRRMYATKLELTLKLFEENGKGKVEAIDTKSGVAVMLRIRTETELEEICRAASSLGMKMYPAPDLSSEDIKVVDFHFYRVPEPLLRLLIRQFTTKLK